MWAAKYTLLQAQTCLVRAYIQGFQTREFNIAECWLVTPIITIILSCLHLQLNSLVNDDAKVTSFINTVTISIH